MNSRRRFLWNTSLAAIPFLGTTRLFAGDSTGGEILHPATTPSSFGKDPWRGLKAGIASYSLRGLSLEAAVAAIKRVGLHFVSIKDVHLPLSSTLEQRKTVAMQFRDAGIEPISCGVISTKNQEASVRRAFEYARDIGVPTIVGNPDPASLGLIDKFVKEFNIRLAIHNHGPQAAHFKSPYDTWEAIAGHDERVGLCIDVGHTARAGVDPVAAIRKCQSRLYDLHFKDIWSTDSKNAGAAEVEIGRGMLDIRGMLAALLEIKYAGHVGFEHEKTAENPLPGVAESVGYTKGVLSCAR